VRGVLADGFRPAAGTPVLMAVRPEHVALGAAAAGCPFEASGTVSDVSYLGAISRLTLRSGSSLVRVDLPGQFAAGGEASIRFGWPVERARILPDDPRFSRPGEETT
jgi:hypothetical protein